MITQTHSSSNCKLTYFEYVGTVLQYPDKAKALFDEELKKARCIVFCSVIDKTYADWITSNYETYYCNLVPVGYDYSGKPESTYHILIKNKLSTTGQNQYLRDLPKSEEVSPEVIVKDSKITQEALLEIFNTTLNRKKRIELILKLKET